MFCEYDPRIGFLKVKQILEGLERPEILLFFFDSNAVCDTVVLLNVNLCTGIINLYYPFVK